MINVQILYKRKKKTLIKNAKKSEISDRATKNNVYQSKLKEGEKI